MASESWVRAVWGGASWPYSENEFNVRNLLSNDIYLRKPFMHDYNGHEAVYLICEIHDSWVMDSGHSKWPINMPKSKKCLKFYNFSSVLS